MINDCSLQIGVSEDVRTIVPEEAFISILIEIGPYSANEYFLQLLSC